MERGESAVGGGSLPGETLPTWLVSIQPQPPQQDAGRLALALRQAPVPVIARVEHGALLLDPRTVQDDEVDILIQEVISAARGRAP